MRILTDAEGATIEDLQSKNGTFVQGERLAAVRELASGDELRFGQVTVSFHSAPQGLSTLTAAEPNDET